MFDKLAYKKQTFEEADNLKEFWKTKTMEGRLAAAMEMTKAAYGILGKPFEGMDKSYYTKRKRDNLDNL